MLYAYWPAGTVERDDVIGKQIAPAPPSHGEKDYGPSIETKVRKKEMQDETPASAEPTVTKKKTSARWACSGR